MEKTETSFTYEEVMSRQYQENLTKEDLEKKANSMSAEQCLRSLTDKCPIAHMIIGTTPTGCMKITL